MAELLPWLVPALLLPVPPAPLLPGPPAQVTVTTRVEKHNHHYHHPPRLPEAVQLLSELDHLEDSGRRRVLQLQSLLGTGLLLIALAVIFLLVLSSSYWYCCVPTGTDVFLTVLSSS